MVKDIKLNNYLLNIAAIIFSVIALCCLLKDYTLSHASNFFNLADIKISWDYCSSFFYTLPLLSIPVLIFSKGYFDALGYSLYKKLVIFLSIIASIASFYLVIFSANLFTLFIGYELLTICTIPLIITKYSKEEKVALRHYLIILIATSTTLFLPALLILQNILGNTDFAEGGVLLDKISNNDAIILLLLFFFGVAKAAIYPFHNWMLHAMIAPHPISAIIHGVIVVKAGVISLLKIILYIFGRNYITYLIHFNVWLLFIPAFGAVYSGIKALGQNEIKKILAYSTISQLNFIILLALTVKDINIVNELILSHAILKVTLFLTAGYFYIKHKATTLKDISGVIKQSYLTSVIFIVVSFSMMGLPLLSGGIVKAQIVSNTLELEISSLIFCCSILTSSYLLKILFHMIFLPASKTHVINRKLHLVTMRLSLLICVSAEFFLILHMTTNNSIAAYKKFAIQLTLASIVTLLSYIIKLENWINNKSFLNVRMNWLITKVEISQSLQTIILFISLIIFMNI
ncbi:MAG: hypothetical protein K9G11_04590 [Rickettsiaceae bacterium]|nr:hypothetical protein [Rickettsiaceae bacterium]